MNTRPANLTTETEAPCFTCPYGPSPEQPDEWGCVHTCDYIKSLSASMEGKKINELLSPAECCKVVYVPSRNQIRVIEFDDVIRLEPGCMAATATVFAWPYGSLVCRVSTLFTGLGFSETTLEAARGLLVSYQYPEPDDCDDSPFAFDDRDILMLEQEGRAGVSVVRALFQQLKHTADFKEAVDLAEQAAVDANN